MTRCILSFNFSLRLIFSDLCPFFQVAIADPVSGFVTGGGWIVSPEGAYPSNPSATGIASFGFFSKYKKGQSVPSGQTQFTFMTGGFEFLSRSYQWLVITGSDCAKFKGIGQISEGGLFNDIDHSFMLTACDGGKPDVDDTFRVKIWSTVFSPFNTPMRNGHRGGSDIRTHTYRWRE